MLEIFYPLIRARKLSIEASLMDVGELIGWGSALLLLPTFGIQTLRQWEARHEPAAGASLWFFILAFAGTGGQVIYSWMVGNRVYFALNACLVVTNGIGLAVAIHRWRVGQPAETQLFRRFDPTFNKARETLQFKPLKHLPPNSRAGSNDRAFTGGFRLWNDGGPILTLAPSFRHNAGQPVPSIGNKFAFPSALRVR